MEKEVVAPDPETDGSDADYKVSLFDDSDPPQWIGWEDSRDVLFVSSGRMCLLVTKNMCLINMAASWLVHDSRSVGVMEVMCKGKGNKTSGWRKATITDAAGWLMREGWHEFVPTQYHHLFHVHTMDIEEAKTQIERSWSPTLLFSALDDFLCQ